MKENYYAVKIGRTKRDRPYFMVSRNNPAVPWLFSSREEAEAECPYTYNDARVVKVSVQTKSLSDGGKG